MMRTSSLFAIVVLVLFGATELSAQPKEITVSDQDVIAILDTDMDGMPDPPDDCSFKGSIDGANIKADGTQGNSGAQLQGCGDFMGTASTNGGIELNFTSTSGVVGFVQIPAKVDLTHGSSGNGSGAGADLPVALPINHLEIDLAGIEDAGGTLCQSGGPAVLVRTTDGTTLLFPLEYYPSSSSPQYLKAPKIPISNSIGQTIFVDGYIPVTPDRKIVVLIEGVDDPVVEIDLDHLDSCGTMAVPTATEWGLIALMLGLLAVGVWVLRQRPRFADALAML